MGPSASMMSCLVSETFSLTVSARMLNDPRFRVSAARRAPAFRESETPWPMRSTLSLMTENALLQTGWRSALPTCASRCQTLRQSRALLWFQLPQVFRTESPCTLCPTWGQGWCDTARTRNRIGARGAADPERSAYRSCGGAAPALSAVPWDIGRSHRARPGALTVHVSHVVHKRLRLRPRGERARSMPALSLSRR
jgi:hypothetical protein